MDVKLGSQWAREVGVILRSGLNSCESWDRTCDQVTKGARLLRLGRDGQGLLGVTVLTV